jgi:hypothetical protein
MFSYNISREADNKAFKTACSSVETHLKNYKKADLVVDVDGSVIQTYTTPNGSIKIYNDYEVDAVYCDSEIDLNKILN